MKKLCVVAVMCLLVGSISKAEEMADRQMVEELLAVTNVESTIDAMYSEIDNMMAGLVKHIDIKEEDKSILDDYFKQVNATVREEVSWKKMKEPTIDIYMKHYTKKEIEDMVAFYKTDTGQSLIQKMPAVMQESMKLSQQMMQKALPKIMQHAKALEQALKAKKVKKD